MTREREREEFEKYAVTSHKGLGDDWSLDRNRTFPHEYLNPYVQQYWQVWQAGMEAGERLGRERGEESFWVVERFENGRSAGYWDGASSRSFQPNIDDAIQFRRKQDAFWATRGWHWGDVKLTEHMYLGAPPPAASTEQESVRVGTRNTQSTPESERKGKQSAGVASGREGDGGR